MSVTLLFTDIEGSTRLVQELGDAYPAALEEHRRTVRAALAAAGGEEIDCRGDQFSAAFAEAEAHRLRGLDEPERLFFEMGAGIRRRVELPAGLRFPAAAELEPDPARPRFLLTEPGAAYPPRRR